MTVRIPVSTIQNLWHDAQRVDQNDMEVEQTHNSQNDASVINNHFGSGVLPSAPTQPVIFDSDNLTPAQQDILRAGNFDGTGLDPHLQPSDTNLGNQLEVTLTGTEAFGRLSTKVLIMGLDFEGNTQYDRFYFHRNGTQVTRHHYARILTLFFNDFLGNNNCSRSLGGRIVIREAASYQLSRDPVIASQDIEPNLFFRDFKVADRGKTIEQTLQDGIGPEYTFDSFGINISGQVTRYLEPGDVSTRLGQKFQADTDNFQKITLLLGITRDTTAEIENRFDWSGDLVISVYELQHTVTCPTELVPELAIEFEPASEPLVQLSYSQAELKDLGYVLSDVLQPVDFVFSATKLGSPGVIVPGRFYCVTFGRSGAANSGTFFTVNGSNLFPDMRLTIFSSGNWVDLPNEDLWFQLWSDAAKVSDGQAYDAGRGIEIPKTTEDPTTGATVDYALMEQPLVNTGENIVNTAVIQAIQDPSIEEQDERTGNTVYSRQKFEPEFSFVTSSTLEELRSVSEPLIIGCAQDSNPKDNPQLDKVQDLPGLVKGDVFTIVDPDADLLSLNLVGSKLIPNNDCAALDYRIFRVTTCIDGYGDVNGDGYIDQNDIARINELVGESLALPETQQRIVDGYVSTLEIIRADVDGDGYITANDVTILTEYVARQRNSFPVGSTFVHMELQVQPSVGRYDGYFDCDGYIRLDGYNGRNIVSPDSLNPWELLYDGYIFVPSMDGADPVWNTVPYVPIPYQVKPQPFWQDYLLRISSDARQVPAAFTFEEGLGQDPPDPPCVDRVDQNPRCDPGRNDIMFPANIIMDGGGQILNPDGTHYAIDLEVGHIILQLPEIPLDESQIDVFNKLVVDSSGTGFTSAGFPAMRFSDGTHVQPDALARNQIRFGVAIQAFVPNLDGYTDLDGYGVIVDDIIGVYMDHANGLLTLTIKDLEVDPIYRTLVTKIQITVYLKKAGWVNPVLMVDSDEIAGLLT